MALGAVPVVPGEAAPSPAGASPATGGTDTILDVVLRTYPMSATGASPDEDVVLVKDTTPPSRSDQVSAAERRLEVLRRIHSSPDSQELGRLSQLTPDALDAEISSAENTLLALAIDSTQTGLMANHLVNLCDARTLQRPTCSSTPSVTKRIRECVENHQQARSVRCRLLFTTPAPARPTPQFTIADQIKKCEELVASHSEADRFVAGVQRWAAIAVGVETLSVQDNNATGFCAFE
jgi:hypothetical protein